MAGWRGCFFGRKTNVRCHPVSQQAEPNKQRTSVLYFTTPSPPHHPPHTHYPAGARHAEPIDPGRKINPGSLDRIADNAPLHHRTPKAVDPFEQPGVQFRAFQPQGMSTPSACWPTGDFLISTRAGRCWYFSCLKSVSVATHTGVGSLVSPPLAVTLTAFV